MQSSTNQIMKDHYVDIQEYNETLNETFNEKYEITLNDLLFIQLTNKLIGFRHFHSKRFRNFYYYKCDYCHIPLHLKMKTIFFENSRFCSERCEYFYDSHIDL